MNRDATSLTLERQRIERELFEERQRLGITLASIGDAVISTDAEGRVTFLNRVAEELTGWPQAEALGRLLPEILRIVSDTTRLPVESPALRALREGHAVDLESHTLLIARDGTERPIDDSAAPMRDESGAMVGAVLVFRDVTEKKRADEVQARLAAIVQSSDDAIISKTLDGVIRSWNGGAERLFGYTEAEMIGKPVALLIPRDRLDEETTILGRLQRGERIEHFETVRLAKGGRQLDISLTVSPIKDHDGRIIGASKIARDITDQKRAEIALRESEGRHRFLAQLAAATQPLSDPAEMMSTIARVLAEHLQADRCVYAEIADQSVFHVSGEHSRGSPSIARRWPLAAFGAECLRCMLANETFVVDDVGSDARVAGALEPYEQGLIRAVVCVPLHKEGRLTAAIAVHQTSPRRWTSAEVELVRTVVDRSWEALERVRAARGLREAAEHLALAFAAARLGDWSWDAATDIVTLRARAAEIFGIAPGPLMTWTEMQSLLHEDDRQHARLEVARAIEARDQYDVEYRVHRPDGRQVWVSAKGRAQYDARGKALGMFGVVQDVTERKTLEEELRQRATQLAEAARTKDEFIALLAHELRNPLAPVRTGLQVMKLAAPGDEETVTKARDMMERQLSHMVRLIDDLLDVSRMNRSNLHMQRTHVLLSEVIGHAIEAVGPAVEAAGHRLEVSLPEEPITLHGDLTRLAQVFGNLLTNSARYTPGGGQIWLIAERRGEAVSISVRDTGIGIPAEALPHVFEMFSQVGRDEERATGGLGIGLALVRGLVEAHGGEVSAMSAGIGAGSTFTVRLPVVEGVQVDARQEPRKKGPFVREGRRALIADDNEDGAAAMADLLELLGIEVHVAKDGVEAVEIAERVRPHLVLMDIGMPRMDGLDATRQIRAQPWGREIKIFALTGWGHDSDREQSQNAGCDGHLVKPVDVTQLDKVLADLE